MTSKRQGKRVPAALRSELTEYSALLRALRSAHTQDLASHLLPKESSPDDVSASDNEQQAGNDSPDSPPKLDLWTRWPLLRDDVPLSGWTLDDEVKAIAMKAAKSYQEDELDMESQIEEIAPYLAMSLHELMSHIFGSLEEQRPEAVWSMVNRFRPIRWENVIDIARLTLPGLMPPEAIDNIQSRLESIYGPYRSSSALSSDTPPDSPPNNFVRRKNATLASHKPLCFLDDLPEGKPKGMTTRSRARSSEQDMPWEDSEDTELSD